MKLTKPLKFRKHFVLGVLAIGVGFLLFYLISTRQIFDTPEIKTPEQKRETIFESPRPSTVQSPQPPSEADIEKAIAALESLDATERPGADAESPCNEANPEMQVEDNSHQAPLSYEAELRQRYLRIKETPEYKAYLDKYHEWLVKHYELINLETPATDAYVAFQRNPYSILGYTKAEGREIELSDEEREIIKEARRRLTQEWEQEKSEHKAMIRSSDLEQDELRQQELELLGMTKEEYYIARDIKPSPPPPPKLPEL